MKDLVVFCDIKDFFDKVVSVETHTVGHTNLPEFQNKWRKSLFFAAREGLRETFKKYQSLKWYNSHIEKYATFLLVKKDNKLYLNCSIQSQKNSDLFIVNTNFYEVESVDAYKGITDAPNLKGPSFLDYFNQYSRQFDYQSLGLNRLIKVPSRYSSPKDKEYEEGLFIFGLGGYAFTHILPGLKTLPRIACVDYKAERSAMFKERFSFKHSLLHPFQSKDLIASVKNPVVVIATFHSDHAALAKWIFDLNPNSRIFIEKPPTVTYEDYLLLKEVFEKKGNVEIGFNRRHIPLNKKIKSILNNKKVFITFSIKEVLIKDNHWYNWNNQGTRLTGNVVHWIDLANYWINSEPKTIVMNFSDSSLDDFNLSISYENGSLANITCSDKGNSLRGVQELIELRFGQETILIEDDLIFKHIRSNGKKTVKRFLIRNKGHKNMYKSFHENLKDNLFEYSLDDLRRTSLVTTKSAGMLMEKKHIYRFD
ncbi:Gfo/Idh/MocA family protein [Winogradskyella sp.]|uniref:Gfo/Idh/MocA family protein n=1 Tax=Winogradskyella sp. TaxID=1883156 RepID=UPI003BAA8223